MTSPDMGRSSAGFLSGAGGGVCGETARVDRGQTLEVHMVILWIWALS